METMLGFAVVVGLALFVSAAVSAEGIYFPPPGQELDKQARRDPDAAGIKASVVKSNAETLDAFWRALLVTFFGSIIPDSMRSSIFPVSALYPTLPFACVTC